MAGATLAVTVATALLVFVVPNIVFPNRAQRLSDLKAITGALAHYRADMGRFPISKMVTASMTGLAGSARPRTGRAAPGAPSAG
jgi:hypothetical protein